MVIDDAEVSRFLVVAEEMVMGMMMTMLGSCVLELTMVIMI